MLGKELKKFGNQVVGPLIRKGVVEETLLRDKTAAARKICNGQLEGVPPRNPVERARFAMQEGDVSFVIAFVIQAMRENQLTAEQGRAMVVEAMENKAENLKKVALDFPSYPDMERLKRSEGIRELAEKLKRGRSL